jgi:hypothetical protein
VGLEVQFHERVRRTVRQREPATGRENQPEVPTWRASQGANLAAIVGLLVAPQRVEVQLRLIGDRGLYDQLHPDSWAVDANVRTPRVEIRLARETDVGFGQGFG